MAGTRITMSTLKQILLLRNLGKGKKAIASQTGVSKTTINEYFDQIDSNGYVLADLVRLEEPVLEVLFTSTKEKDDKEQFNVLKEQFPYFSEELRRVGVNRMILWEEYKAKTPEGYGYSQFCYHYQQWSSSRKTSMHIEEKPADKMYVDFAGKKFPLVDRITGEIFEAEMFVCILGFSGLTYIEFCESQKKEDFLDCIENALHYFEGVPLACVPDNLKSAVTKACRYEPKIARDFEDLANHYGMAVVPTRSRKPRDKAGVERMVNIAYTRICARLRNEVFHDLGSLNQARLPLLEKHNSAQMQDRDDSRRSLFEREERHLLQPLPKDRFEIKCQAKLTLLTNYHVHLKREKQYYSAPYRFCGKRCIVIYTAKHLSIYLDGERIAFHLRSYPPQRYTTNPDHMPEKDKYVKGLSPETLIEKAEQVGPEVKHYIQMILNKPIYVQQAFRSCEGVLALGRKVGKERLIAACHRGIMINVYTWTFISNTIKNHIDMVEEESQQSSQLSLPFHENIRGSQNYK